jgi:hypothetical protein
MNPLMAFLSKTIVFLIIVSNLLNLCISWRSTVLNEEMRPYLSGLNMSFLPRALSSKAGKFFFISLALSLTISSGDCAPAAVPTLG